MYQAPVNNVVIPDESTVAPAVDEAMWRLFVAIGEFWKLGDDPQPYRLRLRAFMANRIRFSPLYRDFYVLARTVIDGLIAQTGDKAKAYEQLFTRVKATSFCFRYRVDQQRDEAPQRFNARSDWAVC